MITLSRVKKSKTQTMILFACNADGTKKLPPFFIGKYQKPWRFQKKMAKELGFYYRGNKEAWMTAALFEGGV